MYTFTMENYVPIPLAVILLYMVHTFSTDVDWLKTLSNKASQLL